MEDMDYERDYRPNHRGGSGAVEEQDENPFANVGRNDNNAGNNNQNINTGGGGNVNAAGFVVKGAPWEQKAPDTASTEEFPTFGNTSIQTPTHSKVWGPRR